MYVLCPCECAEVVCSTIDNILIPKYCSLQRSVVVIAVVEAMVVVVVVV